MDPFFAALFYPLPIYGIGDYFGMVLLFVTAYVTYKSILSNRNNSNLLGYIDLKRIVSLNPKFPEISIPYELYTQFSAKQLNAILVASCPVPPVQLQYFYAPFHFHKQSFQFSPKHENGLIYNDLKFEVDTVVPCKLEIYAGVYLEEVIEKYGIASEYPHFNTEKYRQEKQKGKQKISEAGNDIELQLKSPVKQGGGWGFTQERDSGAFLNEVEAMYKREVVLNPSQKKQTVTIENLPYLNFEFYSKLPADSSMRIKAEIEGKEIDTREEAKIIKSIEDEVKYLRHLTRINSQRKTVPFLIIARPQRPDTVISYASGEYSGSLDYSKMMMWLILTGNVRKTESAEVDNEKEESTVNQPIDNNISTSKSSENHFIAYEHSRELLFAPRIPIIPSTLGLTPQQEDSLSANEWWEIEEVFGGLPSTASLNIKDDDDDQSLPQCCVCLSDPAKVAILPCRHLCMCIDCWKNGDGSSKNQNTTGPPAFIQSSGEPLKGAQVRSTVKWTGCPVCRSSVKSWLEIKDDLPNNMVNPRASAFLSPTLLRKDLPQSAKSSARI